MEKPSPGFSWEELDALRPKVLSQPLGPKPAGFTVAEYQERYKIGPSAAREQLRALVKAGVLEVVRWKVGGHFLNVYKMKQGDGHLPPGKKG
jgi:hypothetical protein